MSKLRHWNVQTMFRNYQAWIMLQKNWALAMMLKALPLVHFWSVLLLEEQMMTSVRKSLKMLVWSEQNWSISSKICPENNPKIRRFFTDCFRANASLPRKFARNSCESRWFFHDFVPKIPQNLTFFPRPIRSPVNSHWPWLIKFPIREFSLAAW